MDGLRQTCYIAEDAFADALFPVMFSEELDPCPTSMDYASLYEEEHGPLDLVSFFSSVAVVHGKMEVPFLRYTNKGTLIMKVH